MEQKFNFIQNIQHEVLEIPPDSIISRTIHQDERIKVVLFGFAPGQELSEHTAAVPAIIHILEGQAQLTLDDVSKEADSGTWTWMAANMRHAVYAYSQVKLLLLLLKN